MEIWSNIVTFFDRVWAVILSFRFNDLLDILLVTFVIYNIIKLIRGTRAVQLFKGLILLGAAYLIILVFDLKTSNYIFSAVFSNFILVMILLFQPEIRHVLESIGRSNISKLNFLSFKSFRESEFLRTENVINDVVRACNTMSGDKCGALIVFERATPLGEIAKTGTVIDSAVSKPLIENIFFKNSPLHDGALLVKGNRLYAAGCILPLTDDTSGKNRYGTRHRAAIGIAEQSDAVAVVVSEERGEISYAYKGKLYMNVADGELREFLTNVLIGKERKVTSDDVAQQPAEKEGDANG